MIGVAEQERYARQGEGYVSAVGMAADGVLEQPAGLGGVAGPDQELRQLELGVRGVAGDASKVADRVERGLPVAAGDRLLDATGIALASPRMMRSQPRGNDAGMRTGLLI